MIAENLDLARTMAERIRINKFLRDCGAGARRKCESLVLEGRVSVNGTLVRDLRTLINPEADEVSVDGERVHRFSENIYAAAYKPRGVVVTAHDPHGRDTYGEAIRGLPEGLFSVGRLDMESEGLLLLTNDGKLAFRLSHPRYGIERVYDVGVMGEMTEENVEQLRKGVMLEDGEATPKKVEMKEGDRETTVLEITLTEGRKREIRRMLAACGLEVEWLKRRSYGPVELGDLEPCEWRHLTRDEVRALRRSVEQAYLSKLR
jgi:pseudouridine synthase